MTLPEAIFTVSHASLVNYGHARIFTQFTITSRPSSPTFYLASRPARPSPQKIYLIFKDFQKCWSQTADWPGSSRTLQTPVQAMMVS